MIPNEFRAVAPTEQLVPTPHTDALRDALDTVTAALDAAHADGLEIPPVAAVGASNLAVVLMVLHGQELARGGEDPRSALILPDSIRAQVMAANRG